MKLYCKGCYHNGPAGLHFEKAGVIEVDDWKGEYLLRDAPENFSRELPAAKLSAPSVQTIALDEPLADKMVRAPSRKK